ncbi:MAG: hypothetical protein CM15mP103_06570 [Gammaproteobacteria bacterium]|nr:MAG: hypothetical protein CM15mP103_06570 [Gammaproteobacteria bacterium]
MADFLGTSDPGEVLIGANMTTLTYQLSRSLAHQFESCDEIIISRMEHEGNVSPWLQMAEDNGLIVNGWSLTEIPGVSNQSCSSLC